MDSGLDTSLVTATAVIRHPLQAEPHNGDFQRNCPILEQLTSKSPVRPPRKIHGSLSPDINDSFHPLENPDQPEANRSAERLLLDGSRIAWAGVTLVF